MLLLLLLQVAASKVHTNTSSHRSASTDAESAGVRNSSDRVVKTDCQLYGSFEGSGDISMWRDGQAFVTSGLAPSATQEGMILLLDLRGPRPALNEVELLRFPAGFGFRPHGLFIENRTQRLFAVSHSELNRVESIVVMGIFPEGADALPKLQFQYAITSPRWEYWPAENLFFLNDLVVTGLQELYATQYGPQSVLSFKYLWRCTWSASSLQPDGTLPATCEHAYPEPSLGLAGVAVDAGQQQVWVNDLHLNRLWVLDR